MRSLTSTRRSGPQTRSRIAEVAFKSRNLDDRGAAAGGDHSRREFMGNLHPVSSRVGGAGVRNDQGRTGLVEERNPIPKPEIGERPDPLGCDLEREDLARCQRLMLRLVERRAPLQSRSFG